MGKTITFRLDDDTHRDFKIYATKNNTDMTQILLEYIKKLLNDEREQAEEE